MNESLRTRMQELRDLGALSGLASWDQETYMPPKAEAARGSQLGTIQGLYHERLTDPRLGDWLAQAAATTPDEKAMVRVLTRERDRALKVPGALVKAIAEGQSHALAAWREARTQRDYSVFRPKLEAMLALRREQADAYGHSGERYDALLENYEPGMRVARLDPVLTSLRAKLVPLVQRIEARPAPVDVFAGHSFEVETQWQLTMQLLKNIGFDLQAGRQDKSIHPFSSGFHATDVRITTRLVPESPMGAIFGTIHEAGHGLYEQGFAQSDSRTVLAQAPSMGLHESQSRLWENLIGRSRAYWQFSYPLVQKAFPHALGGRSLDDWYRAINRVERTFIRVEADEVTYNLHIVLRYELELALLRGQLTVADLESAWNEKTKSLLGLEVKNPMDGVLQDIHWAWAEFGYFPTYALGNLYSASLLAAARRALPDLDASIAKGDTSPLLGWLRTQVHRKGSRLDAEDIVTEATGQGLTEVDFIAFLNTKYGELYGLNRER
jgi:carboxypeptidase Taq